VSINGGTKREIPMSWLDWLQASRRFDAIDAQGASNSDQLARILTFVSGNRPATHVRMNTQRSQLLNKKGSLKMSGSANVTTDHDLRVPLVWKDDVGSVSAPTSGTSATSDNAAVATVDVAADDLSVVVRSVAIGTCNISVTNGPMNDTIVVNVTDPAATILDVDATDAVLITKGAPA
jgi:hypothetical protein